VVLIPKGIGVPPAAADFDRWALKLQNKREKTEMSQPKTYHLVKSWRYLLLIPILFLILLPIVFIYLYSAGLSTLAQVVFSLGFMMGLASLAIFYGFTNRLVTSPDGIKNYFFHPLNSLIPWGKLERIEKGPFGNVFLTYQAQANQDTPLNTISKTLQLDSYIDDWQNSDFVQDLRCYAPQISIPNEILLKRGIAFLYRTSFLLLYFTACIIFLLIPAFIPKENIRFVQFAWDMAIYGYLGGSLGGMAQLLGYSVWINSQPDNKYIKRKATLLYITPLSAWGMVFILAEIFHVLTRYEIDKSTIGTFNMIALAIGFAQFSVIQRLYFGVTKSPLN
jgi:hypothetical protein